MQTDARVDALIGKAQPFAKPILTHLRALLHEHCPDGTETMKWSTAAVTYKGTIVSMIAGFKEHVTFGFWYGDLVTEGTGREAGAMGSFGRITSLADLPVDAVLARMIVNSVKLIDDGVKAPQYAGPKKAPKPEPETPLALATAIAANGAADAVWQAFTPAQRREYAEWIAEAKREETRDKRVAEAVGWIAEGKKRNWKYEGC
jgi:uncharacterized protein YdeI (YjbR/CyaY-like superfamily)